MSEPPSANLSTPNPSTSVVCETLPSSTLTLSLPHSQTIDETTTTKITEEIVPDQEALNDYSSSTSSLEVTEPSQSSGEEGEEEGEEDTSSLPENGSTEITPAGGSLPSGAVVWTVYIVRRSPLSGHLQLLSSYLLHHWRGGQLNGRTRRILLIVIETSASEDEWSMEEVLDRLLHLHHPRGPPPASQSGIDSLPTLSYDQELSTQEQRCSICFEDYQLEEEVLQLPCKHFYHRPCLVTWLQQHNTCPVCRYEMEVEDADYEKQRRRRMNARGFSFLDDQEFGEEDEEDEDDEEEYEDEEGPDLETDDEEDENPLPVPSENSESYAYSDDLPPLETEDENVTRPVSGLSENDWNWEGSWQDGWPIDDLTELCDSQGSDEVPPLESPSPDDLL